MERSKLLVKLETLEEVKKHIEDYGSSNYNNKVKDLVWDAAMSSVKLYLYFEIHKIKEALNLNRDSNESIKPSPPPGRLVKESGYVEEIKEFKNHLKK